jgi:tartrate dehydrogenase/decarboxylase/D-malate dehydrogenase
MLAHLGEHRAAEGVRRAVAEVFAEKGVRTPDLGGTASTGEVADAVAASVRVQRAAS